MPALLVKLVILSAYHQQHYVRTEHMIDLIVVLDATERNEELKGIRCRRFSSLHSTRLMYYRLL